MKQFLLSCSLAVLAGTALAAPNDTTVVRTHNATQLSWYGDYDEAGAFPDGSISYRKIVMEFNVGKYACPGYDPNNPGEGSTQTGWCADWDYDVHVLAMTAAGDTIELGRLITPYANSNNVSTPANWNHSYFFDVTDYYTLLKDAVTIRIHYSGYSGGFTGTINFHMIEGTRPRDVVGIRPLWRSGYGYGNAANPINDAVEEKNLPVPATATQAEMKFIITGHGGDNKENCAEFCRKWYAVKVDGVVGPINYIWRDDCGKNFLYPQSGTWIHNRANWCPGDQVQTIIHPMSAATLAANDFDIDVNFQTYNYTGSNPQASYKISGDMFFFREYNKNADAGIEAIISPNSDTRYNRENPVCKEGKIRIKNFGATTITSVSFKYGVNGSTAASYTWSGSLASNQEQDIFLPVSTIISGLTGANTFTVVIDKVNGNADDDVHNNEMTADFEALADWQKGEFMVELKSPGNYNGVMPVGYTITDENNNIVFDTTYRVSGAVNQQVLKLPNGCYTLEFKAPRNMGLSFFNAFTRGYFRVFNINDNNARIPLPKVDLGGGNYEGNVGAGFTQYFRVSNSAVSVAEVTPLAGVNIYPNPATGILNIDIPGTANDAVSIEVFNAIGQRVHVWNGTDKKVVIETMQWSSGLYTILLQSGKHTLTEKVVVQ